MSGGGLEATGVAFAALSIAPAPDRGMAALEEPPIAWPDHPLAVSDGEILAARILPLMGRNARDFARAAAVCRGWRAAFRAAAPTLSVYREAALQHVEGERNVILAWSPCGKFVAATVGRLSRLFLWRASTGALLNEWALSKPATAAHPDIQEDAYEVSVAFSRDSTRVLTLLGDSDHFAVWSVPDGQLLAVNPGDYVDDFYNCVDFGVPGSASDGLVGFGSYEGIIYLWDVPPPLEGGVSRPSVRSRVNLGPVLHMFKGCCAFSPDGSKFLASFRGVAYVYDVASLARLGAYSIHIWAKQPAWVPDGRHVLVTWDESACVWDFGRPEEAPPVFKIDVGPCGRLHSWSPNGASYFVIRQSETEHTSDDQPTYALEERRAADGSLVRAVCLGHPPGHSPVVIKSPGANALLVSMYRYDNVPARFVVVFE